jgi:uncharacterized protein (UPF0332 family)
MNGHEFLASAKRLSESPHAADLRSSVSRAYYAAYHVAHDFLVGCGIRFSSNTTEAHTKMPQCLENSNVADAVLVGRKLRSLRDDRNTADYELDDPVLEDSLNVAIRLRAAEQIVNSIDAIVAEHSESASLCAILRGRARSLGLRVVK